MTAPGPDGMCLRKGQRVRVTAKGAGGKVGTVRGEPFVVEGRERVLVNFVAVAQEFTYDQFWDVSQLEVLA